MNLNSCLKRIKISQLKNARILVGPPGFNVGSYGRWVETGWHILPTDVD